MIVFYKALMNKIHSGSLVSDFFFVIIMLV